MEHEGGVANTTGNVVYCRRKCRCSAVFGGVRGVCPERQGVYTSHRKRGRGDGIGENTKEARVVCHTKDKRRVAGDTGSLGHEPDRGRRVSITQLVAREWCGGAWLRPPAPFTPWFFMIPVVLQRVREPKWPAAGLSELCSNRAISADRT